MDLDKAISYFEKYTGEYLGLLYQTLAKPTQSFRDTVACSGQADVPIIVPFSTTDEHLRRRLAGMVVISLVAGTVFNSLTPSRKYSGTFIDYIIVVLSCWCCFTLLAYAGSRLLNGKASFGSTVWVSLQIFSSLYLVSSFLNLVGGAIARLPAVNMYLVSLGPLGDSVANNPVYIYFLSQFILLNIYLPLTLKQLNGFGWIRAILIALLLSSFWIVFDYALYGHIGVHYRKF